MPTFKFLGILGLSIVRNPLLIGLWELERNTIISKVATDGEVELGSLNPSHRKIVPNRNPLKYKGLCVFGRSPKRCKSLFYNHLQPMSSPANAMPTNSKKIFGLSLATSITSAIIPLSNETTNQPKQRKLKMTRTRRTPAEIAADLANKAQEAAARAAVADAVTNPILAPLASAIKSAQSKFNMLKRSFADTNPNSFDNRKRAFELRIVEVEAGAALAAAQCSDAEATIEALKGELDSLSRDIANGHTITETEVSNILATYGPSSFPALENAFKAAHDARKSFKGGIGATPNSIVAETPTEMEAAN